MLLKIPTVNSPANQKQIPISFIFSQVRNCVSCCWFVPLFRISKRFNRSQTRALLSIFSGVLLIHLCHCLLVYCERISEFMCFVFAGKTYFVPLFLFIKSFPVSCSICYSICSIFWNMEQH